MKLLQSTIFLLASLVFSATSAAADSVVSADDYAQYPQQVFYRYADVAYDGYRYGSRVAVSGTYDSKGLFIKVLRRQAGHEFDRIDRNKIIVFNRYATYWFQPADGAARYSITVPFNLTIASWDVTALEKELERLGVKVKPKPGTKPSPKPGVVISG